MNIGNITGAGNSCSEKPANGASPGGTDFNEVLAKANALYNAFLDASREYNISPALLKAVASAESGFNPNSVSSAGAVGLMQIMPETASQLGIDPSDPVQSVYGAAKYMRSLMDQFNGNATLAIAAYNAGPGAVEKYNGIPPYKETQDYVAQVSDLARQYSSNSIAEASTGAEPGSVNTMAADTGSQPDAAGLAELLLMWTEEQGFNALSQSDSDSGNDLGTI